MSACLRTNERNLLYVCVRCLIVLTCPYARTPYSFTHIYVYNTKITYRVFVCAFKYNFFFTFRCRHVCLAPHSKIMFYFTVLYILNVGLQCVSHGHWKAKSTVLCSMFCFCYYIFTHSPQRWIEFRSLVPKWPTAILSIWMIHYRRIRKYFHSWSNCSYVRWCCEPAEERMKKRKDVECLPLITGQLTSLFRSSFAASCFCCCCCKPDLVNYMHIQAEYQRQI